MIEIDIDFDLMVKGLKDNKRDFELQTTNKTKILKYDKLKFLFKRGHETKSFTQKELGAMVQIKSHVKKKLKHVKIEKKKRQNYYDTKKFSDMENGEYLVFENCFEVDINKAYFQALKNMSLLDDDLYQKYIKLDKNIRLALVGSLATRKSIYSFKDGVLDDTEYKVDKELREVFFCCVDMVDEALKLLMKLQYDDFLFYWVDGAYIKKNKNLERDVKFISQKFNFDFSTDFCEKIVILKQSDYHTKIGVRQGKKKKVFNLENLFTL